MGLATSNSKSLSLSPSLITILLLPWFPFLPCDVSNSALLPLQASLDKVNQMCLKLDYRMQIRDILDLLLSKDNIISSSGSVNLVTMYFIIV